VEDVDAWQTSSANGAGRQGVLVQVEAPHADDQLPVGSGMVRADAKAAMMAAFAGDDVVAEFEQEKEDAVQESIKDLDEPLALPGWGVWANSKREPRYVDFQTHQLFSLLHKQFITVCILIACQRAAHLFRQCSNQRSLHMCHMPFAVAGRYQGNVLQVASR
jgi:hypothetical protein